MTTTAHALRMPAASGADAPRLLFRTLLPLAALHVAMLGYDLREPERFLNADRAGSRLEVIERFGRLWQENGELGGFLAGHGIAGDWLPHALLYLAGGQYLVIAVQVLLALLSVVWVRDIGLRVGLAPRRAHAAAALYGLLPHTLVFPHQLAAEALFVPLVILSFRFASGGALGAATLVRPITALWPLAHAVLAPGPWRARLGYLAAALVPLLAWMGFVFAQTGELSMGKSGHDLGTNLYHRAHRMAAPLPPDQKPPLRGPGERRMGPGEYLGFVLQHPGLAAAHSLRDLAAVTGKSGIERLVLDYFDLFPASREALQDYSGGWRARLEREGPAAALRGLLRNTPGPTLASLGGAALFTVLLALALLGARAWLLEKGGAPDIRRGRLLLILFVLYIVATAQSVDAAQSRHRAPAEFALCSARARRHGARKKASHGR